MRLMVLASILIAVVLASACGPTAFNCVQVMPTKVLANDIRPAKMPDGTGVCVGKVDDVPVTVELLHNGLSWRHGRVWVDGRLVDESGFTIAVEEAKGRIAAEKAAARAKGFLEGATSALQEK